MWPYCAVQGYVAHKKQPSSLNTCGHREHQHEQKSTAPEMLLMYCWERWILLYVLRAVDFAVRVESGRFCCTC